MSHEIVPVFVSHYSIGNSILTLEDPEDVEKDGPASIIKIAKDNALEKILLLDDCMTGFPQLIKNCKKNNLQCVVGVRLKCCQDVSDFEEATVHSIAILAKNDQGYRDLLAIHNFATLEGRGFVDFSNIERLWTNNLLLAIPFYGSFIHQNSLKFRKACVPKMLDKAIFFIEDNLLPFDSILHDEVVRFAEEFKCPTQAVKTIKYEKRSDIDAFITYKLICGRKTYKAPMLSRPNIDHMSSSEFCWESYLDQVREREQYQI